jgi:hypothetical protein
MATGDDKLINILSLTDCLHFTNGSCIFKNKCRYRHCSTAAKQLEKCCNWPRSCRNMDCPYRHTGVSSKVPKALPQELGLVSFFWDIENVPIPRGQKPFDIVQRIRQKLVIEPGLQEADFSCYGNINIIPQENQQSLHHANVRIVHVPDRKPGAADRQIMLELDRFERAHRPPATIVLISGDIDFVGKLSDLRHRARFHVIIIHNKPAKEELKATVNAHYPWELFTEASQQQPQQPFVGNNSERLANQSTKFQPVLNNRSDNAHNIDHARLPSLMQLPLSTKFDSPPEKNLRENDISRSNVAPTLRHPPIPRGGYHPTDSTQLRKPPTPHPVKQTPTLNADSSTPPFGSTSIVAPRARIRRATSTNQLDQQQSSAFGSTEQIPSSINADDAEKKKRNPLPCPFCSNEFSSIQALRQHQKDKDHVYRCQECKESFPTANSVKQHQTAKGHNDSKHISDQHNAQFDTADDLNTHQLGADFQNSSNVANSRKQFPACQTSVTNQSAIHQNRTYVSQVSDDED